MISITYTDLYITLYITLSYGPDLILEHTNTHMDAHTHGQGKFYMPFSHLIICAKLYSNPTMHDKGMGQTGTVFTEVYALSLSADCDLDL